MRTGTGEHGIREPRTSAIERDRAAWHALPPGDVATMLGVDDQGLSSARAEQVALEHGLNLAAPPRRESWLRALVESFIEPLQLLLVAVAVLSFVFGEAVDGLAILGVIVLSAAVETASELRAARSIEALHDLTAPSAHVRRDGRPITVPATQVVPGDVLLLEPGDIAPADARILDAHSLSAAEASLTGEPVPVHKSVHPVPAGTPLAERSSVVHAGSVITSGTGTAVVFATGQNSELGQIAALAAAQREPATPLQIGMGQLARIVLVAAVVVSVGVPALGLLLGQPVKEMLLTGLSMAFATVPEELPILVTVLLAVGGRGLAQRGALLRWLSVGEAMGSVTSLLTDKTGTLTRNELSVARIDGGIAPVLAVALAAQGTSHTRGARSREPLEQAVAAKAAELGMGSALAGPGTRVVASWPFDQHTRLRATAWADIDGNTQVAVAGAPEAVLAACAAADQAAWRERVESALRSGERTLAYATAAYEPESRTIPREVGTDGAPIPATGLQLVGLVTFVDPVREGVPAAVAELHRAGIATLVVTGDHPAAGRAAAAAAGLPEGHTLTGGDALAARSDDDLAPDLVHGTVIGRCTPADKLRLVRLLQSRGEVVAVTGDGVNDAPALSAADVGIAMGRRGTQMARQVAGLVLTDDAYPTVAAAVETGRSIFSQLRRAVSFYLGAKLALVAAMVTAIVAGLPIPYAPVQIVVLELFMDIGASMAFVSEPAAPAAMRRPPRPRTASLVDGAFATATILVGAVLGAAATAAYLLVHSGGASTGQARCAALVVWLAGHVAVAWSLRARPGLSWRANPYFPLWAGSAVALAAAAALTPAAVLVRVEPLVGVQVVIVGACAAACALVAWLARPLLRIGTAL
ncbi:cation-translocating P-type ATPase [Cellulomonas sp. P24]|uniref:cation-translocating P-type ATPase n=1 Tax=Cellulomonas sp. P24 TaxID=2885206 RepID=UPI00216B2974|nr:cation-translocating P-type ATPase [Cellulomonas sp. P24]MCR6494530.1 cation-translocating P-type ATPase [Cellulomonas sp. P24]